MESDSGSESSLNGRSTDDPPKRQRVGLLYDDRMCKHETPDDEYHPENPNRIRVIWDKLNSSGIAQRCVILNAKEVEDNHLALVHTKNHIDLIKNVSSKNSDSRRKRVAAKFNSIYFNEGSSEAACLAAGSVIEVAEKVAKGELDSGFAIVRPPGHHAEKAEPMGFCLYNNVAVATSYLLNERPELGISKILIVDWDVHHGNGTQKMFYKDPRALIFSVHRHEFGSFYPATDDGSYTMTGEGLGAGYNINVPWENGRCGDADYLAVWDHILIPVVKEFNPDMIIISAGFDAAIGDPLGGCRVSPFGYSIMLDKLMDFAGGKIVMALEGGYNLYSLANSAQACVEVLLQHKPITGSLEACPFESTWRVIQVVRQELSEYWSTLAAKLPYKVISQRTSHLEISSSDSDGDNENGSHSVMEELDVENFMQPFVNLKVHETGQDQEATTASPSWRSELSKIDIWYATYGSNMNVPRFRCYIEGGQTEGMRKPCVGAMDKSSPKEIMWKTFPHRLFFARDRTTTWGPGGVAFLHPNSNVQERTYMCLYKITLEQFNDVFLQENASSYNMGCPLFDLTALQSIETEKCISVQLVQRGWYHNVLYLGKENDIPILTMTCTLSDVDNFTSGKFPITPPCKKYANTLVKGLVEGKQLTEEEALAYINEASNKPLKKHRNWPFVVVRRKVYNGKMVNLDRMLGKQHKNNPGHPGASSSGRQPPRALGEDSSGRQPARAPREGSSGRQPPKTSGEGSQPPQPKGGSSSGRGVVEASAKSSAPPSKRSRPEIPKVKHGKGKPLCPHLYMTDPPQDLWRHPDLGAEITRHNVREVDLNYLHSRSIDELLDFAYSDLARMPPVLHELAARAKDAISEKQKFEEQCRDLSFEVSQLKLDLESTRKQLEEELSGVREELRDEISSGRRYHETLGGQRFLQNHIDGAISEFKVSMELQSYKDKVIAEYHKTPAFEEAVEEAAVLVFDQCLAYCRERLINSGRYPGDKFEFLDPDWVEMIESSPTGHSSVARASQGTRLLSAPDQGDDTMVNTDDVDT